MASFEIVDGGIDRDTDDDVGFEGVVAILLSSHMRGRNVFSWSVSETSLKLWFGAWDLGLEELIEV
ncbi:MAG: hypothetical protein M1835_005249, partial [Candelina submexicana]